MPPPRRRRIRKATRSLATILCCYLLTSYVLLPFIWRRVEGQAFATSTTVTESRLGIPGDPLNVSLAGEREEVIRALLLAGWQPADPLTFKTSFSIATSILLNRPYPTAPVSNLYLWGRKQDLAFERVTGSRPTQRHHVRLWLASGRSADGLPTEASAKAGRPLWIGAATFDQKIGFNRFTGELTHHIDPNIDTERDTLMTDLSNARQLENVLHIPNMTPSSEGRNAQGDRYVTDGVLSLGEISTKNVAVGGAVTALK